MPGRSKAVLWHGRGSVHPLGHRKLVKIIHMNPQELQRVDRVLPCAVYALLSGPRHCLERGHHTVNILEDFGSSKNSRRGWKLIVQPDIQTQEGQHARSAYRAEPAASQIFANIFKGFYLCICRECVTEGMLRRPEKYRPTLFSLVPGGLILVHSIKSNDKLAVIE